MTERSMSELDRTERGMTVDLTDVSVRFGGLDALTEVSLHAPSGSIVGLIGPNGAGKTTLFNAISGFVRLRSGRIELDGVDVSGLAPHRRVALGLTRTFQHAGLVPDATVRVNLLMAQHATLQTGAVAAVLGRGRREERAIAERAGAALERLGLEEVAERPVRVLSHGRRKLVELACALVRRPAVLLLDEPSAGLDRAETDDLAHRLIDIQAEAGCTTLVIDHDLRLVRQLASHVVVLSFGEVIAAGTWDEIRADRRVVDAYLGPQTVTEELPSSAAS